MRPNSLSKPGKAYVFAVTAAGVFAVAASIYELIVAPVGFQWFVLAALTIVSGSATVKLPSVPASLSVSETFVFTSVLLFGPPAGTLTVALDGLIISLWLTKNRKELHRVLFNIAAPAVSIWVTSKLFFLAAGIRPLAQQEVGIAAFLGPLLLFTVLYFLLNSWLIAFAVSFETNEPAATIWRTNFVWLSLNFFCGASVAALLTVYPRKVDLTYLGAILPLLFVLYLTYRTSMARVEDANQHLGQINQMYLSTIETLAMAIDAKDQVTHGHIRRVQAYAVGLARALGISDPGLLRAIEAASLLHDMGKLAVPEHILNKPGKLTAAEFDRMKLHASIGADILSSIHFPYPVIPIVRHHHENWDGTGYPHGLKGTAIPIGARILAVVDCFDALTSDRPYRPRLSNSQAISILMSRRGTMYDPLVVDVFVQVFTTISPDEDGLGAPLAHNAIVELTRSIAQNATMEPTSQTKTSHDQHSTTLVYLSGLASSLAGAATVGDAFAALSSQLTTAIPSDLLVVYVYDRGTDTLHARHVHGLNESSVSRLSLSLGEKLTGWIGATKNSVLNSSAALDFDSSFPECSHLRSVIGVPLVLEESLIGVLCLYSRHETHFTSDELRLLELLSAHLALVISKAPNSVPGRTDLTRVSDVQVLIDEQARLNGGDASFALLVVSAFGYQDGFVELLRSCLRSSDLVITLDAHTWMCVLAQTDNFTAGRVADRLREELSGYVANDPHKEPRVVLACAPVDGRSFEEIFAVARHRATGSGAGSAAIH